MAKTDTDRPSYERDSPFINAPTWPWVLVGWMVSVLHVFLFLLAWMRKS